MLEWIVVEIENEEIIFCNRTMIQVTFVEWIIALFIFLIGRSSDAVFFLSLLHLGKLLRIWLFQSVNQRFFIHYVYVNVVVRMTILHKQTFHSLSWFNQNIILFTRIFFLFDFGLGFVLSMFYFWSDSF